MMIFGYTKKGWIIMTDQRTLAYIASLPEVETARLLQGTLFWAEGRIYQVTEVAAGGFHKAREWRHTESTEVALIPGSFPARHLPLVRTGRLLPIYHNRLELTDRDQLSCFVFPTENLALDAAYLDVALVQQSGVYVRNQGQDPAFAATDGVHVFRLYYYRQSNSGRASDLSRLSVRPLPYRPQPHSAGPGYWRLLPTWTEIIPNHDVTQQMPPVRPLDDQTLPHIPILRPPED